LLILSRHDFKSTFDVRVGSEILTLHTTVFTERSGFFRTARKPEWLKDNPNKPVELQVVNAELFRTYVNCVYFGSQALQNYADEIKHLSEVPSDQVTNGFEALLKVYILAETMQDLITANLVIDEFVRFGNIARCAPGPETVLLAYACTTTNSPLRLLMRDYRVYDITPSSPKQLEGLPVDFMKDITLEVFRVMRGDRTQTIKAAFSKETGVKVREDKCHYHQHDDKHPRCVPKETSS
jgi:hypothetical protein